MDTTAQARKCFYIPNEPGIIDVCKPDNTGLYSNETLDQIRQRYPGAELADFDTVCAQQDDYHRRPPIQITEKQYTYYLEVLPPEGWKIEAESQSFKMMERTSGLMTGIYAIYKEKYYCLTDSALLTHDQIIALIVSELANPESLIYDPNA